MNAEDEEPDEEKNGWSKHLEHMGYDTNEEAEIDELRPV